MEGYYLFLKNSKNPSSEQKVLYFTAFLIPELFFENSANKGSGKHLLCLC